MLLRPANLFQHITLALSLMTPFAMVQAGQKIEYSVPSSQVNVPDPAKEQRDAALFDGKTKTRLNGPELDFEPPANVSFAPQPFHKQDKDNLFGPKKSDTDDPASKKALREKIDDSYFGSQRNSDSGRLSDKDFGGTTDVNKNDTKRDATDRYSKTGDPYNDRRLGHGASSYGIRDFKDSSRTETDFSSKGLRGGNDWSGNAARAQTGQSDPLKGLGWAGSSSPKGYTALTPEAAHLDRFSSKSDAAALAPSAYGGNNNYHSALPFTRNEHTPSAGSGYFQQGNYTPPPAPRRQVAPAILDFPKRPGDPLR